MMMEGMEVVGGMMKMEEDDNPGQPDDTQGVSIETVKVTCHTE